MRVLFRADASPAMGTGHAMRCLALAEALSERGHECHFLLADGIPAIDRRLAAAGVALARLTAPAADGDAIATCRHAAAIDARAVIVDGYHFSASWYRGLRRAARPVLAFYDGIGTAPVEAEIVVSPGLDTPPAGETARWLCGPAYILLRRELRRALAAPLLAGEQRRSLLVGFGGSDPAGLTIPVVEALAEPLPAGARLEVVIGGGVRDNGQVAARLSRLGAGIAVHLDPRDLGGLMREARLAVSAAGTTAGELAAFGVPAVIVVVADNQLPGARQAAAKGWCRILDARSSGAAAAIAAAARRLWDAPEERAVMARSAAGAVDGKGVDRVAEALIAAAEREH
jgi:UDP-2,4-diacetamido-2,4,6-trideoxy-beta-L-altropyranose hydrolase